MDYESRTISPAEVGVAGGPSDSRAQAAGSSQRPLARPLAWTERHALFIAAVAVLVLLSLVSVPAHLEQDGWLALVAGRIIASHGVPHHDYLTVMAYGVRWTDQQWLAQLAIYELYQIGGLALFSVFYVGLTGVAFALAVAAARSLGGRDTHILAMLIIGAFFYLVTAVSIRTQGFAYPLFVGTLWLLARAVRDPSSRRVYFVFPILILWANLHGSVTLGAGMAMIYGATLLWDGLRTHGRRGLLDPRGLAFVVVSPLCLFVTPYGTSVVGYYRDTLFNSQFGKIVTEWQPVTAYTALAVPLLLVILGIAWTLGKSGRRAPVFDQLVLGVLALGAIDAVRNITWFGLAVAILLPGTISRMMREKPPEARHESVNLTIAFASTLLAVVFVVSTFLEPASWFERDYPKRTLTIAERIYDRDPGLKIFADVHYADWLVWHDPRLAGHIAYDTSFENLTHQQLASLSTLGEETIPGQRSTLAPYGLLVLNPANHSVNRILLAQPGVKVIFRVPHVVIATKPVTS